MSIATLPTQRQQQPLDDLIEQLLAEQSALTAVEQFSQHHADASEPVQRPYYRELLPATPPGAGEQYAFEVDLDVCSGCKACVIACHSMNGLDEHEIWREVGLLTGDSECGGPMQRHVTTACHHCVDPGCLNGCPVAAYEKDPATGVVFHLDDQCIGCKYCTLTCPYEVPKYHDSMGIVRKCDMCRQRLAREEAPACVQSCPNQAIRISIVKTEDALARGSDGAFLPSSPHPEITKPTTRYNSEKPLPANLSAGDRGHVAVQEAHPPLVWMLLLTQLAAGLLSAEIVGSLIGGLFGWEIATSIRLPALWVGFAIAFVGMHIALLHLGRPLWGFRALLGLRTSWLSREILAFGMLLPAAGAYTVEATWELLPSWTEPLLGLAALAACGVAVFASAMVYGATKRPTWLPSWVMADFFTTAIIAGTLTMAVIAAASSLWSKAAPSSAVIGLSLAVAMALSMFRSIHRTIVANSIQSGEPARFERAALLLAGPLRLALAVAFVLMTLGGVVIPAGAMIAIAVTPSSAALLIGMTSAGLLLTFASLAIDRYVFFLSAAGPKMPGFYTA